MGQPQSRQPPQARPALKPDDMPWMDLDDPMAKDQTEAALREEEPSPPAVNEERAAPEPEHQARARRRDRDEQPVDVPLPEPVYPPTLTEDVNWDTNEAPLAPKSEATVKPAKAGKRLGTDVAGVIYLILLALVAASLSAAVVLFLF